MGQQGSEPQVTLHPRWASAADNQALIELARACPMQGAIDLYFDRSPDFFQLSALQGNGARVCVIEDVQPGLLAACAAVADYPRIYLNGEPRAARYACDLRIRPNRRRGLLLKRLYDFLTADSTASESDLGFTTIMAGNQAMAPVLAGRGGLVKYIHVATMRNYAVQLLMPKRESREVQVQRATRADLPEMVQFWNRIQAGKQFAPVWDEAGVKHQLEHTPGLDIGCYRLARRGGRLVGLCVAWNQSPFKRMIVLGYAPRLQRMQAWYNPLAPFIGRAQFPLRGRSLSYFYTTHLCAESAADLRALLVNIYNAHLSPGYLFTSIMIDVKDPLSAALKGFMSNHFDIELYAMDPDGQWKDFPFGARPAYFDPAMV